MGNERAGLMIVTESAHRLLGYADGLRGRKGKNGVDSRCR